MPKFLEEIQLPSLDNVIKPRSGVSIYNDGGAIKVLHSDGTSQQLMVADESGEIDFSHYYTKSEIDEIIAGIDSGDIDLSDYYTKDEIDAFLAEIANRNDLENYYTKTEIDNKNYASQTYVNDRVTAVDARVNKILLDAPEKYDTLKEIAEAFDSEDGVFTILNNKQDKLSEADFKKVNGVSVFGPGDITVSGGSADLSNYYSKDETYSKDEIDSFDAIITENINTLSNRLNNTYDTSATVDLKIQNATKELEDEIFIISDTVDDKANAADVYTKSEIDSKFDNINFDDINLENYYTKSEVDEVVDLEISALIDGAPEALNTLKEIAQTLENDYPKTTYLESQIRELRNDLDGKADDSVINDLENSVTNVNTRITNLNTDIQTNYVKNSSLSNNYYNKDTMDSKLSTKVNNSDLAVKISEINVAISDAETRLESEIALKANSKDVYTKTEVDKKLDNLVIGGGGTPGSGAEMIFSDIADENGTPLRTIKVGEDIWSIPEGGSGGNANLSNYYTKAEVDAAIDADIAALIDGAPDVYNTFKEIAEYIESDLTGAAAMQATIANKADITSVYNKTESDNKYALKSEIPAPTDLTNYYNKTETEGVIQEAIKGIGAPDLSNYYNKSEIDAKVETINATKQNKLIAGDNITISEDGVISSTGGGGSSDGSAEMIFSDIADETGTPLRTIKVGEDIWSIPEGGSNIDPEVLSNYYTKAEIEALGYQTSDQVNNKVAALVNSAPETLDTLGEIAIALNANQELVDTLNSAITNKQDKLISGTNLKTINNESILGTGNIDIDIERRIPYIENGYWYVDGENTGVKAQGEPGKDGKSNPQFVNDVSECTDTSKLYLLPDGNIWAYTKGIVENKVNQYKPDTAQFNVRYNNGAMSTTRGFVLVEVEGLDFTNKSKYIVKFSGKTLVRHTNMGVYGQVTFFKGSEFSSTKWIYNAANANSIAFTQDDTGYYVNLMDAAPNTNVTKCYFAICLADNTAITAADCDNLFIEFVPLTTYTEEYGWRDTGLAYANYVLTESDTTIIAEKVDKKINSIMYVDGETGSNSNSGNQESPLKTIQKAIDSGAKTIYCKAGTYNENITLKNAHGVKIIGQWKEYESGSRPKVRIDHSTTLTPTDNGNGLKTINLPSDLYKYEHPLLYNVFVTKQYQPTQGSGVTIAYTVSLWNTTSKQVAEQYKLVPVMTLEECQSTEETFFYDGTTLYIHSVGSTFKMVSSSKRNIVENCSDVVFEDIAFDYCYYDALAVNNSNGVIFRNCEFSHSSTACGIATNNMNGEFYNCEAYRNRIDGFNLHKFGETTVYNCIGAYNYDDGISHHDGCTGSIHGGQYHHNGKGGVSSPTYGAVIDIYNVISHNNQYGIYAIGGPADRQIILNGCYIHHNTYGIASPKYELLVIHSTITDNSTNTSGNVTVIPAN